MGGSMGSVVGEMFTRAGDVALERGDPARLGRRLGRRAHAGERARADADGEDRACAVDRCASPACPYISVLAHPTTGGVIASFAALGDVVVAEPDALLSFAGPRVVQETTRETLPDDFGRAESSLEHGLIDVVVPRHELHGDARPDPAAVRRRRRSCRWSSSEAAGAPSRHRRRACLRFLRSLRRTGRRAHERRPGVNSRLPTPFRGLRRRLAERAAESDIWDAVQLARDDEPPVHARLRRAPARRVGRAARRPRRHRRSARSSPASARFRGRTIAIVGHQKGRDLKERAYRNFGMAQPAGLRQGPARLRARRPPRLPGRDDDRHAGRATRASSSEQAGQAGAIARSMLAMARLRVPSVAVRDRRGRLRRRARDRRRRPRADARALDLLGDLTRGLRGDPLARRQPAPQGRGRVQADRALLPTSSAWSTASCPSPPAARTRITSAPRGCSATRSRRRSTRSRTSRSSCAAAARRASFREHGRVARDRRSPTTRRRGAIEELVALEQRVYGDPRPRRSSRGSRRPRSGRAPRPAASRRPTGSSRARSARARARPRARIWYCRVSGCPPMNRLAISSAPVISVAICTTECMITPSPRRRRPATRSAARRSSRRRCRAAG